MNFAVLDRPYLFEFRFNMKTGAMTETQISDVSSEFPVVRAIYNYEYNVPMLHIDQRIATRQKKSICLDSLLPF